MALVSFTTAVAAGAAATAELQRLLSASSASGETTMLTHRQLAVAWSTQDPWLSTHDDGEVFVLLDGRLHEPWAGEVDVAARLSERYRESAGDPAAGLLGDFILIVLDRRRDTLLVSRDPLGVRPWYQAEEGARHSGASEVASLCALEWVDDRLDEAVALSFLAAASESRGPTLHRGVATLPPGSTWRWTAGAVIRWRHHVWKIEPEPRLSWATAVERTREVFAAAVRSRLRAAEAATSELSGGLDSSGVVGTLKLLGADDLLVGRLLFDGAAADERSYSDAVLRHWDVPCVSTPPWLPTDDDAEELTRSLRRPPPDENFTMFRALHEALLERGRRLTMTGLGGDDAFVAVSLEARILSAVQLRQGRRLGAVVSATVRSPRQSWRRMIRPTLRSLAPWVRQGPPGYIRRDAADRLGLTDWAAQLPQRMTGVAAIDERLSNCTSGYWASILEDAAVVGDMNRRRNTHPFLDPRLITATYGVDPWFAAVGNHTRALEVAVFADRLPSAVATRRTKAEFSQVVLSTTDVDDVERRLLTGPLMEAGWLDPEGFGRVLNNAREGQAYAAAPLSRALALDRYLRLSAT